MQAELTWEGSGERKVREGREQEREKERRQRSPASSEKWCKESESGWSPSLKGIFCACVDPGYCSAMHRGAMYCARERA